MAHDHSHNQRQLTLALGLTGGYCVVEFIGGWIVNSLALLSDAGHMLSDVTAMGLSLFAAYISTLPVTSQKTFGYYRAEILAAFFNGLALWLVAGIIFREAYYRFFSPPEVQGQGMILIAGAGLFVNLLTAWMLHGAHDTNLNLRGVFLHVLSDALGSVGAIIAGVLILWTGWYWADPVTSMVIGCLILLSSFSLVRESVDILMQATPRHLDLAEVQQTLESVTGVARVHDLHVWTLTSGLFTLTAHVVVNGAYDHHALLNALEQVIQERFGIDHTTIQLEPQDRQQGEPQHF
ncbi:MAG TPA: cation diffusion facilitator family transporter [Candidatus Binatia bacterium]|jgi:cobalt-zinc-cadmium efflux system protein|nr:cation diffusion facilitator family transporter [Candidatus Binatia bacterium]